MSFAAVESPMLLPIAALGLVFGSFVTALSYRLPRGESVARGRSRCPACGHTLTAPDLVPVFSWVLQGGKCRHCGTKISRRYPLIEGATMALFVAVGIFAPDLVRLVLLLAMTPLMMALAVTDLEHRRLPNLLVLLLAGLGLAWRWHVDQAILAGVVAALIALIAGLALDRGFRRLTGLPGLGMGDTKLFAVAALALPLGEFLLFSSLAGLFGVAFGLAWRHRAKAGQFPFAPAVLFSLWLCFLGADKVLRQLIIFISG